MQATSLTEDIQPWTKIKMVCIAKNDLSLDLIAKF
jgi:hypothetical protein